MKAKFIKFPDGTRGLSIFIMVLGFNLMTKATWQKVISTKPAITVAFKVRTFGPFVIANRLGGF